MNRCALVAGSAATIACVLVACSDSSDGPNTPRPLDPDAAGQPEAKAPDAASIRPRPELCQGLARGGPQIAELELATNPPAALGGTVLRGTYDLVELNVYAGPPPAGSSGGEGPPTTRVTGQVAQITLLVTEFELRSVEARAAAADGDAGLAAERSRAVLYRIDGTSLVETEVCPKTALPVSVPFSAVGGGLAIFTDAKHRELYVRRNE
jgi:hypothetical protein